MFGFLKNILHRSNSDVPENNGEQTQGYASEAAPAQAYQAPRPAARPQPVPQNGKFIDVPVQSILEALPLELQPRVRQMDVGPMTISVPLEKVLAQLSRGVVRVSFGELRQAVPGVFSSENDRDRVMVALPLSEILGRLNPALITRRRVQQQMEVPADIANPFDPNGGANYFSCATPTEEPEPAPAPPPQRTVKPQPRTTAPVNRGALGSIPPPTLPSSPAPRLGAAPVAPPHQFVPSPAPAPEPPAPVLPVAPPRPNRLAPAAQVPPPAPPIKMSPAPVAPPPTPARTSDHAAAQPPAAAAMRLVREALPIQPAPAAPVPPPPPAPMTQPHAAPPAPPAPLRPPHPAPAPAAFQSGVPAAAPAPAKPAGPPILLPLASLADAWPEQIRKEIVDLNLVDAQVALPANGVEQGLKQGRIVFTWKSVRAWLKPAVPATASPNDATALEMPLKVVAPSFLARQKETKPQEKVAVDEDIPNLFFGFPQPESAPAAVNSARPADTNFYVWGDTSDTVTLQESEVKRGSTPGTKFVAKYATPNEVVSRAAGLEGVAGALIALPDGLMVANQLPPELNGDTLAAFLPQIFGKVSQCTKELRMGELNNLNFTVGNVPWKIFRVNAIFFAAFGRPGEPLPTAQLAALAAELDHKPK